MNPTTREVGAVGVAAARQRLEAGVVDGHQATVFLFYETPKGRIGDAVRLGDLGAAHTRLTQVIFHSHMARDGVWYCGGPNAPRALR